MDVSSVDTTLALPTLGIPKLQMPIMIAPVAMQRLAHEEGEIAAARACAAKETVYCTCWPVRAQADCRRAG